MEKIEKTIVMVLLLGIIGIVGVAFFNVVKLSEKNMALEQEILQEAETNSGSTSIMSDSR